MKKLVSYLLSQNNSMLKIGLFDPWHFLYLAVIFGGSLLIALLVKNRSEKAKEKTLRIFAYLTIIFYVGDFFLMPLSDSYSGISVYKLPFNICTLMATLVPFAQFNKKFSKIKSTIAVLSMAGSLMWMCYPGTALGGQPPFSYIIFQTFMYHGILFAWGFLNVALGEIALDIKKVWRELVGILAILVWADLGNTLYGKEQNWFFIETSIFPFLTDEIMPVMVVGSVFGVCLVIYGINYAVKAILSKKGRKSGKNQVFDGDKRRAEEKELTLVK